MKLSGLLLLLISCNANATKWLEKDVTDPIDATATCAVRTLISTGGYIYNYPSKYDQVFSPFTTPNGIWYCKTSGFIALMGDFEISSLEKEKIKKYLENDNPELVDISSKLKHLEAIYTLREKDMEFKNRLKRTFAYLHEKSKNITVANRYRKEVLNDLKIALGGELNKHQELEYLYLSANYERQFGNKVDSDKYILELKNKINNIKEHDLKNYSAYLSKLLEDTIFIKEGGVLQPVIPHDGILKRGI